MMKQFDEKYTKIPMKQFLMANEHDIDRIEKILFRSVSNV